jgi:hypothetical protein
MIVADSGAIDISGSIGHGRVEWVIAYPALIGWSFSVGT